MAGTAAARQLTPVATAAPAGRFAVTLAAEADDEDVRCLLREPLPGDISVSLEREPDSRHAAAAEGDVHQTLIAREAVSGRVAAIGSRSVRDAFINGRPARVGYLGQLRIAQGFRRSRTLLDEGFAFCRRLHDEGDAQVYLTAIVADNQAARRLLLGTRSRVAPRFASAGRFSTLIVPRGFVRREPARRGVDIRAGSPDLMGDIAACLRRNGGRYQLAPCWTTIDLCSPRRTPHLSPEDFVVATRGERVVGCAALWDQRPFKQAVVRGYSARLARWRPLINAAAPLLGTPRLPPPGQRLDFVYLSHVAVDGDDADTVAALMAAARARLPRGIGYLVAGFATDGPLFAAVRRRFPHREYRSELYLAYWPDGEHIARGFDARPVQPEVAVL